MQKTQVWSLARKDPLEEGMLTHSFILAWRIPWTEEPARLWSMGLHSQTQLKWLSMSTKVVLCLQQGDFAYSPLLPPVHNFPWLSTSLTRMVPFLKNQECVSIDTFKVLCLTKISWPYLCGSILILDCLTTEALY